MVAAARTGRSILRPVNLAALAQAGLVSERANVVMVTETVPLLAPHQRQRLSPSLRRQHLVHEAFWASRMGYHAASYPPG
jgi:hypothetical protein